MIRWIAFDEDTAEAIVSRFKRGATEIHHGNPLDEVLNQDRAAVMLLPSATPGRVLLARFTTKTEDSRRSVPNQPLAYEPSGFLGLVDEPVFNRRPPAAPLPAKKKWWQRRST
jgi:hypothetical protein